MTPTGSLRPRAVHLILAALAAVVVLCPAVRAVAPAETSPGATLANSIRIVPDSPTDTNGHRHRAFISRATLQPAEAAAPMKFEVALAMRNFDELEARLAHSEIIPPAEFQQRYLPLAADYDKVQRWLESAGMTITRTDENRLAVFVRASVAAVGQTLQTTFARVTTTDGEFTSAISAPTVPANLASVIRGIHGLQPHIRMRLHRSLQQAFAGSGSSLPYYPAQIAQAYNANTLGLNGTGQTIAVYALGVPANSDLTAFWSMTGVGASLSNIETVNVAGGPAANASSLNIEEATLDVQWASALAPGARVRIYAANENDPVADDELIQQILADLPNHPSLHQLTISFGIEESSADRDYIAIEAQYMATLVGSGVTVFAASGDSGAVDSSGNIQTWFPASMPDVTAVGGTSLRLDASSNISSEIAWGTLTNAGSAGASGGGVSKIFSRPAWQNVTGAPSGPMRLVPDVACVGDPSTGGLVVFNGKSVQIGGTSLASPIWAAWCALMNQGRAATGKSVLGALNPRLYPFAGTAVFHDITSGGNSVYQAGIGYDLCTGVGTPNVGSLYQATLPDTFSPVIEVQSGDRFTTPGQSATFYVVATGAPTPSFQWQRLAAGSFTWANLSDNGTYSGTTTFALSVLGATTAMNLDQYRCIIGNSLGSVTSAAATLTVGAYGVTTLAGWPGWSGYADGQGANSRFDFTGSVRTDAAGTLYVADASNNTIRKITPAGVASTFAGSPGVAGSTDGSTSAARFNGPAGVAIDSAGNVFVADSQNYTIRKISPAGVVSTLAGSAGVRGHADGTGSNASFYDPQNLAVDSSGNLYVADGQGNSVRKVTPAGVVTTLAGSATPGAADGTGSAAQFNLLAGIAVDAAGNVYVGDYRNNTVRKINQAGAVTTLAGLAGTAGFVDGTGNAARLAGPTGMAVDAAGNVLVADSLNNAIRKITPSGVITTLSGAGPAAAENIDGPLGTARFNGSADVAIDGNGVIYVADGSNCTVRRITLAPAIAISPLSQHVVTGNAFTLTVAVTGMGPFSYQWFKDGTAISGATNASYAITGATSANGGSYVVQVATPAGTLSTSPAVVSVTSVSDSRIVNLSVRAFAGSGAQTLTVGLVFNGSVAKGVLLRGVGPGLVPLGVSSSDVLPDPLLTTYGPDSQTLIAVKNDNWSSTDATGMASLGAFPLTPGSTDAAVFATLAPGVNAQTDYTAQIVDAAGRTGVALAEIYDASLTSSAKLVNISGRAQVGTNASVLIAGFIIRGTDAKRVLIRGVGPTLSLLQVPNPLADPRLDLYDGNNVVIQSNDNWGGSQTLTNAFNTTGAFGLPDPNSKDAAMIVQLAPGSYTAVVSGVNGTTGVGLVEIYEMPAP